MGSSNEFCELEQNSIYMTREKKTYIYTKEEDNLSEDFYNATGLDASRGVCIISEGGPKAVFVDSRYTLAAHRVIDDSFTIIDYTYNNVRSWIQQHVSPSEPIFFDWNIYTVSGIKHIQVPGYNFIGVDRTSNMKYVTSKIINLGIELSGQSYKEKFKRICHIFDYGNALLLNDSASICWLFNIRGNADPYSLSINAHAIVYRSGRAILFTDANVELSDIEILPFKHLKNEIQAAESIVTDPDTLICKLASYRNDYVYRTNPCLLEKAIKNTTELKNMQQIHIYDSVAVTKFLYWINSQPYGITELEAASKLREFRRQCSKYITDSFECISAADAHAAEIHFHTTESLNQTIQNMYLCDSGGQYYGGTTDITRTISLSTPTQEQIDRYTRVLKGHIDVFLSSPNNGNVDALARQYLQEIDLDYGHGTGHGVGYMSQVHEGPTGIYRTQQIPFTHGMILSNEPGYYKPNEYGIRIENMMYVDHNLTFRTLTLVPYCKKLIDPNMLTEAQKHWLFCYNAAISQKISPFLADKERQWLLDELKI